MFLVQLALKLIVNPLVKKKKKMRLWSSVGDEVVMVLRGGARLASLSTKRVF
jgi:hypothetical protein